MKHLSSLCLLLIGFSLLAQNPKDIQFERQSFQFTKQGTFSPSSVTEDFFPRLHRIKEEPNPDGDSYRDYLQGIKLGIQPKTNVQPSFKTQQVSEDPPIIGQTFVSNLEFSQPNDNDLAISDDGWLVSVVNSSIFMTDVNDTSYEAMEISLNEFVLPLDTLISVYDPKVVYDPNEDRFILAFLNEFDSENSSIILCFSSTNNPTELWNLYEVEGNPLENNTWTDYPMLALTENELFITANLLQDGLGWIEGFAGTIVWQFDKSKGYAGETLETGLWTQTVFNGNPVRNAIPIEGGSALYGPNLYLLSNRNFSENNDSIFFMEITGDLDDENAELKVDLLKSEVPYGVPPNGRQVANNKLLLTNDARILGAYYEEDRIHFVSTTLVPETGLAGVYHGIIEDVTGERNLSVSIISDTLKDYAYPNLSYTGFPGDDQCIISFDHTSPEDYPGGSAIFYRKGEYSEVVILKEGTKSIGSLSPSSTPSYYRWGDYTGSERQYSQPGVVWTTGTFGKLAGAGPSAQGQRGNWVAQLTTPFGAPAVGTPSLSNTINVKTFPNPSNNFIYIDFNLDNDQILKMRLYNIEGKLIKDLHTCYAHQGKNQFKFSTHHLPSNIYILKITNAHNELIANQKIIVE